MRIKGIQKLEVWIQIICN